VAFELKRLKQEFPDKPFKQIINEVLRSGLQKEKFPSPKRFRVEAHRLGLRTDLDFDNIEEVLDIIDEANC
jgi:hypothetical protein